MNSLELIYLCAHIAIVATATWAIFSSRVNDGLMGRFALTLMVLASLSAIGWAIRYPQTVDDSDAVFSGAVALMAIRCWALRTWVIRYRRAVRRKRNQLCN